jgi:hypothetical protein
VRICKHWRSHSIASSVRAASRNFSGLKGARRNGTLMRMASCSAWGPVLRR